MDFSNNPHLKNYFRKKEMELEAKKASRKRIIEEQNRKKWLEYQQHLRNTLGFGYDDSLLSNYGFTYSNFSTTAGLSLVGDASVISDIIYLTTAVNGQTGNVYRTNAIRYNRNFSVQWSTFIGGSIDAIKADGYCVQWTSTNNTIGIAGGGVGLIGDVGTINAITFKTYTTNSYAWYKNNVLQSETNVSVEFWRQTLYFWGDYNHSAQTFELYWNTTNSKPVSPNETFNSFSFDSNYYYMGFGAATGGANDNHQLLSWSLQFT